ncbi:MAG: hypothetical protein CL569_07135 [Alphaproteobacteria bacterium]|nr:hypothetical protein [Alphaproteobacteria bacterium]
MGRTLRFRELESIVGQLANSLLSAGVVPGEFIAVLGRNSPQYAALHFGAAGAGVIPAHVSVRSTPEEVTAVLEQTNARLLFHDEASSVTAQVACDAATADVGRVLLAEGLKEFLEMMQSAPDLPDLSPEDPLCVTYSGGTTGAPKGVLVSHRAGCDMAGVIADSFGLTAQDIVCDDTAVPRSRSPGVVSTGNFVRCDLRAATHLECVGADAAHGAAPRNGGHDGANTVDRSRES